MLLNSWSRSSHDLGIAIILKFLMTTSAVQCFPRYWYLVGLADISEWQDEIPVISCDCESLRSVQAIKTASLTSHQQKQMERVLVQLLRGGVSHSNGLFFQFASEHLCFHPRKHGSRYLGRRHFRGRKFTTRTEASLGSYSNPMS